MKTPRILATIGVVAAVALLTFGRAASGQTEVASVGPCYLPGDKHSDGLRDLFVAHPKGNRLYRNLGNGEFEDVTEYALPGDADRGASP